MCWYFIQSLCLLVFVCPCSIALILAGFLQSQDGQFRNLVAKADVLTEVFFFPMCGDGWFGADDVVPSILLGCCALVVGTGRSIAQLAWPRQLQPF